MNYSQLFLGEIQRKMEEKTISVPRRFVDGGQFEWVDRNLWVSSARRRFFWPAHTHRLKWFVSRVWLDVWRMFERNKKKWLINSWRSDFHVLAVLFAIITMFCWFFGRIGRVDWIIIFLGQRTAQQTDQPKKNGNWIHWHFNSLWALWRSLSHTDNHRCNNKNKRILM